jgi:hypothetical protein
MHLNPQQRAALAVALLVAAIGMAILFGHSLADTEKRKAPGVTPTPSATCYDPIVTGC